MDEDYDATKDHPYFSKLDMATFGTGKNLEDSVHSVSSGEGPKDLPNVEDEATFKARERFKALGIIMDEGKDLNQIHSQIEFARAILTHKDAVEKVIKAFEPPKVKLKVLEKRNSPGMFTIPCSLGGFEFKDAFCDSGSYVSVISSKLANSMKLEGMQHCRGYVTFGDQSTKRPKGVFKDFPVKIGSCIVPTDLLVLDMVDETNTSLLFGIPFLLTVGAKLDYVNRVVSFAHVDKTIFYPIGRTPSNLIGTIKKGSPNYTMNGTDESFASKPPEETLPTPKPKPKRKRRTKKKKDEVNQVTATKVSKNPVISPITLVPLTVVDGKLECKVKTKTRGVPFKMVKILLSSSSQDNQDGMLSAKMAQLFNIKLGDRGPQPPMGPLPLGS